MISQWNQVCEFCEKIDVLGPKEKYNLEQDASQHGKWGHRLQAKVFRVRQETAVTQENEHSDIKVVAMVTQRIHNFLFVLMHSLCFQNSMNLPPDKARLLRQYDNEKKWDLICDQVQTSQSFFSPPISVM